jgi:predicted metal-binding protein
LGHDYAPPPGVELQAQGFACLGNCRRRCRMSVAAPGRWAWLIGDIAPGDHLAPLCAFLDAWLASPDGAVPKDRRPEALRRKLIGRVAPVR